MCVCMYARVYICMYVYMYVRMYICMCVWGGTAGDFDSWSSWLMAKGNRIGLLAPFLSEREGVMDSELRWEG